MVFFDQNKFIKEHILQREDSFFAEDITNNWKELDAELRGSSVLVIGGGGTIGSSFIKAILPFRPDKLTVVDYSENSLTELTRDLRSSYAEFMPRDYITYPFDFGGAIFSKFFRTEKYDVVACFAAHKHVRSEKDQYAIEAMIRNNVFNTYQLLTLCLENKPRHFFSVSTDKAANPVNVMGASKKIMEMVLLAFANEMKISTARFANVAFSNGSLLAGFNERIMKRQPLSSPSDVKRYFVSPEESGHLCMLACVLGKSKDIFYPKLTEVQMLTFSEIAERYLFELGLKPDYSISEEDARQKASTWHQGLKHYPVFFFQSDTSGEKMYEEFHTAEDEVETDLFKGLGVVKNSMTNSIQDIQAMLYSFEELFQKTISKEDIVNLLYKYIPDFSHVETGRGLDSKM